MARLPRLVLAGHAHALLLPGLAGRPVFADAQDRHCFIDILLNTAKVEACKLHAYALLDDEVRLVATPVAAPQLACLVQAMISARASNAA